LRVFSLCAALLVSATVQAAPAVAPMSAVINVSSENLRKTAEFKLWKSALDKTQPVGQVGLGIFCSDGQDIIYTKGLDEYNVIRVGKNFLDRSAALGYPKFEGEESAFAEKLGLEADFKVGFTLLALHYDICGSPNAKEFSGTASVKLRLELYSNKLKRIVYTNNLEGKFSSKEKIKSQDFDDALFNSALDVAFSDKTYVDQYRDIVRTVEATEKIDVVNGKRLSESIDKNSKALLGSVVTVEGPLGSGSGFYVGYDGYIVTNQHVVGEAKSVRIKFPGGFSISGEVMRTDPMRDVALIKTASATAVQLSIRKTPVKVGEVVFAIGSPFGEQLSGTVTRGIVSAERVINEKNYIQSDAAINQGNSGGPLLDANGEVIAMAQSAISGASGIGMFIPVKEALDSLGMVLK